ncbi:hypothetical protein CKAN_01558700 [Cinnamomum micranthum f. kanehirae]|uniref:Secreted protein n=1 Tax=Cinnamomum micranthum f. kanehirae TaxID=337451 RepID=A0A3S3QMB9_9MAGN|nr:hypothetical protein CKAN_01558700 [Cinnamomum micranthum f. kanehirae]
MLRLMPKILALIAVHRQTAASRLTRPCSREQQGSVGGDPTTAFTSPSTLAHTPSFSASLGHLPREDGVGTGVLGTPGTEGVGLQEQLLHRQGLLLLAVTREKKRRLRRRKKATGAELFEAISKHKNTW